MIFHSVDESGGILSISYSGRVTPAEMDDLLDAIRHRVAHLRPGFLLFSDLTSLDSMDPACATGLGIVMELLAGRGIAMILRVIPDPARDIGFNLISRFHLTKPVSIYTVSSLAEALKILLEEAPVSARDIR